MHFINAIGGNDIAIAAVYNQQPPSQIISTILPQMLAAVRDAIVVRSSHITSNDDIIYSDFFFNYFFCYAF
jgi:hypothetical protein